MATAPTQAASSSCSTAQVVRARHTEGSRPGARTDPHRLALVIEGGSSRSAYSSGMVVAIERLGLREVFDAVYGVSGGALNGAWLLCGRAGRVMDTWWNPAIMRRIIAPSRALRGRPVLDTDFLVNTVYTQLVPMDFAAILASPVSFHPVATDLETGRAVDLAELIHDEASLRLALRASTGMPVLAGPPIELAGRRFADGGLAQLVPLGTALAQGATHVVALRTRRPGELPRPPGRVERHLVSRYLHRHAGPAALGAWHGRYAAVLAEEHLLATHPGVVQIRPPAHGPSVTATSTRAGQLRATVALGEHAAEIQLRSWLDSHSPSARSRRQH